MAPMQRRHFLLSSFALLAPRSSQAATASIEILPDEPIGTISPNIYGHFTEHLGGCIYDGIWVGERSKIPNIGGIRKELVERLRELKPPVIRWPGGCFADSYNWRDGIGPRTLRPKHTNFWDNTPYLQKAPAGPQKYEPNEFGTNEFARFCKLVGAEPYFAGNLRSLPAKDFYEWIEYCNSPAGSTTGAQIRAQGGDKDPLNVQYWGVGNESWGCGGNFTGDEYAVEYRRFSEWIPRYDVALKFIASGPNGADYAWTRSFLQKLTEKSKRPLQSVYGSALHYYCSTSPGRGNSIDFTNDQWYELLGKANRMEELIGNHWAVMGEVDTEHHIKLVVDEWGAWHETDPSIDPRYLWAYFPSLRDALVSGLTLDTFHRHADKVAMANAAQLVNNIHTSFVAREDKFTVTPVYHVFKMYGAHGGGTSVRAIFSSGKLNLKTSGNLPELAGSCSIHGKRAVLTVTNPSADKPQTASINIRGSKFRKGEATVLTSSDLKAHNSFEHPNALAPSSKAVDLAAALNYEFPPASVTRLDLELD